MVLGCGDHEGGRANNYAPVVKAVTVRLLLAIAFVMNMVVHQLDVSNAFLYANIQGDVYICMLHQILNCHQDTALN